MAEPVVGQASPQPQGNGNNFKVSVAVTIGLGIALAVWLMPRAKPVPPPDAPKRDDRVTPVPIVPPHYQQPPQQGQQPQQPPPNGQTAPEGQTLLPQWQWPQQPQWPPQQQLQQEKPPLSPLNPANFVPGRFKNIRPIEPQQPQQPQQENNQEKAPEKPKPQPQEPVSPSPWNGVWRQEKRSLPMFDLKKRGGAITGRYAAPDGTTVLTVENGKIDGDKVEFMVDNAIMKVHFRLTMGDEGVAKVEAWVAEEDWMEGVERAKRMAKTPQQAATLQALLGENKKMLGKPTAVGTFKRKEDKQ
jgi:hypothetical protein